VRTVLYLAYHFPPIGGGGVQRNGKFVRYLPDFGWRSIVVTGPGRHRERWTPVDETLNSDVPTGTTVHRLSGEPEAQRGWRAKAERWLGHPDRRWRAWWTQNAVEAACAVGRGADVVYASLVPFETAPAALVVADRLRLPLVVDLQDPWALDEMMIYPSGLHRRLEVTRMRRTLGAADAIVMNTPEAALRVERRFPELRGRLVVSIPNGYDAADFREPLEAPPDGVLRIVHSGYLHTELGLRHRRLRRVRRILGGAVDGVDILTRSHVFLLEAISTLLDEEPELADTIEVHLVGVLSPTDMAVADQSPVVRTHGYLGHAETLRLVRTADLLFLPMHDVPNGHRIGIVPGKTYEYLASARPILAAVPDGDARELLEAAGTAFVCRPSDVAAMRRIIREQVERVRERRAGPVLDVDVAAQYERRALTHRLARVLDEVSGSRSAHPARTDTGASTGGRRS
jgi:glycosyltransferase involved in cell wall biosynthesis